MFFLFFLIVSISWFNMFSLHCHSFIPHGVGLHLYQLFTVNPVLSLRISLEGMVLRSNNPWSGTLDGCCASAALNIIQPAQITILTFYINVVMNICVGKKGGVIRIVIFVVFFCQILQPKLWIASVWALELFEKNSVLSAGKVDEELKKSLWSVMTANNCMIHSIYFMNFVSRFDKFASFWACQLLRWSYRLQKCKFLSRYFVWRCKCSV
jgi:hypothetical protein